MPSTSAETAGVPEAPGAWPLVGHAPRLLRDRLAFLQDTRMHGDLVAIRIGPRRAYVVNSLELVRDVLTRRSSQFQLSPQFQLMQRIIGNGLLVTDGAFHRRQRRLVLAAFHRQHVRGYASVMASLAQHRFDGWREGVLPALDEEFGSLAAEVVARCLFSSDCDQRTADRIAEDLPHLMTWVGSRGFDPSGLLAKLPTPVNRRFHTSNTRLHGTVRRIIAERRASGVDGEDLLAMLLRATDAETGQAMSDQQVHDEAMTVLAAGTDTVSHTLSWCAYLLSRHPAVQRAMQAEMDQVLAGRAPCHADMERLPYTRMVISEVLRLYPAGYLVSRTATTDTTVASHPIAAGSMLLICYYALQRAPEHFPDPDAFRPERWSPDLTA